MTDIVPAEVRGLADPTPVGRLAVLDSAAAEYARPIRNTEEAYRADWRVWLRFLEELNLSLTEEDPHGTPVPPTVTNLGVFVAFMAWHERKQLAPSPAARISPPNSAVAVRAAACRSVAGRPAHCAASAAGSAFSTTDRGRRNLIGTGLSGSAVSTPSPR